MIFTSLKSMSITLGAVTFGAAFLLAAPCFANEYEDDARRTAAQQAEIDAEQAGVHERQIKERQERAERVDGVDSVQAMAMEGERQQARNEAVADRLEEARLYDDK